MPPMLEVLRSFAPALSSWATQGPPLRHPRTAPAVHGKFADSEVPAAYTLPAVSRAIACAASRELPPRKVDQTRAPVASNLAMKASPAGSGPSLSGVPPAYFDWNTPAVTG